MVLLDAYAIIAALVGEPAAPAVEAELRKPGAELRISAVNEAEVVDTMVRVAGVTKQAVDTSLQLLAAGGLVVTPADEQIGMLAGRLRAKHYDLRSTAVSLADCVALATSMSLGASLATADPALANIARKEGVLVVALPDSRGRKP
jgi:PIN domain nuclease of toxin-antitoxin system